MYPKLDKNVQKRNVPNETWRKVKQFLFVMNVEMNR